MVDNNNNNTSNKITNHVKKFSRARKDAKEVLSLRIVEDAQSFKKMDKHINELLQKIKTDFNNHEPELLKKDVKNFETEIHEEIELLFKKTKQDLELFIRTLNSLSGLRKFLSENLKDNNFNPLSESELGYAEALKNSLIDKIDTLNLLFKKIRK